MDLFPIPLFPHGALSSSVITTVWVGVMVVAFFNLRFGWVLSGLVVPGYLVPLLLVKPWAALVIVFEGGVTYFIVWFLSEFLSRLGYWSNLFGRDRFFALVLVSIAVRVFFDGWALPGFGQWLTSAYGLAFDYRSQLHSFGLIIITLVANQFWKTGFYRGLLPLIVTVGVSFLIIRFGLMEFTNFTVSNLSYMYEDLAASILASPKAYIILLITAFVASRMNLLYGWDYSGILIPSLLALQWYQPEKILATFAESFVILIIAHFLLKTKWMRNAHMEGARKLVLFFNIGFVYKLLLAFILMGFFPPMKITDTYAFGYLLATLMALKMHDKDIAAGLTRATLQTSLSSVAVASVVGFALTFVPLSNMLEMSARDVVAQGRVQPLGEDIDSLIRQDKLRLYEVKERGEAVQPLSIELDAFEYALRKIKSNLKENPQQPDLSQALTALDRLGYEVLRVQDKYLYLRERGPVRGWGSYVVTLGGGSGFVVEVPAPMDEVGVLSAATQLFLLFDARALAIAGTAAKQNPDGSSNVLLNRQSFFHVFHKVFARHGAMQVRGGQDVLTLPSQTSGPAAFTHLTPGLWVSKSIPENLDLRLLKSLLGELNVHWSPPNETNRQRESSREGFVELALNQQSVRSLRARAFRLRRAPKEELGESGIDGYLREWLLSGKHQVAARGSNSYRAPRRDELLYFDEEVLTPLLALMRSGHINGTWTPQALRELLALDAAAQVVGYRVLQYRHRLSAQDFLILSEDTQAPRSRYWGTYVLRVGLSKGFLVEVPRPLYEVSSFEYAVSLYERLNAVLLAIGGTHPDANPDGSADLVRPENVQSLFSLVNQVVLREAGDEPQLVVHSRALGYREAQEALNVDALVAFYDGRSEQEHLSDLAKQLLKSLDNEGLSYRFVDGSVQTAGYEVGVIAQSLYLPEVANKEFCALWVSALAREGYRQQTENRQEAARFSALGIVSVDADLYEALRKYLGKPSTTQLDSAFSQALQDYLQHEDIVTLRRLQTDWPALEIRRIVDRNSHQSFMLVLDRRQRLVAIANLHPLHMDRITTVQDIDRRVIEQFVQSRATRLDWQEVR